MKSVLLILLFLGQSVIAGTYLNASVAESLTLKHHHCNHAVGMQKTDAQRAYEVLETEETRLDDPTELIAAPAAPDFQASGNVASEFVHLLHSNAILSQLAPRAPPVC